MRAALILATGLVGVVRLAHAAEPSDPRRPDEVALRYYATQKQTDRVEAEAARLRLRHPGWQPPADLWTAEPGAEDETAFWDLLAAGRIADLRSGLAERARTEPGWKPSSALANALSRRALRDEALELGKTKRWPALAALADRRRADVEAGEAELLWAVAEAWGRTERGPDALGLLRRMLAAPRFSAEERRVAILRGLAFLSMAEVGELVTLGRPGDFDAIRIDLIRGRISAVLHDEAGQSVAADDITAFESYAEGAADPNQPALIAWYAFKRRDFPVALAWFKRAIGRGGDAMVAHGLAHTLRQLGLMREAEEVAYAWREPLVNNTVLFLDILERDLTREVPPDIELERLKRYAQVTAATASGEGAQALAWYAYNNCQFDTALSWFQRAVAWFPKEATVYGYALTLRRLHRQRAFVEMVNRYDGLFPKVVDLLFQAPQDHPMPCEGVPARTAAARPTPTQVSGYLDLSAGAEPRSPDARARRGQVPQPDDVDGTRTDAASPLIRRNEFPVPVAMENDLRAAPSGGSPIPQPHGPDRPAGGMPTIARRVPGVGPMPYERFGFSLLPAWNGEEAASVPNAAERPAPQGTQWSDERSATGTGRLAPEIPAAVSAVPAGSVTGSIPAQPHSLPNPFVRRILP